MEIGINDDGVDRTERETKQKKKPQSVFKHTTNNYRYYAELQKKKNSI